MAPESRSSAGDALPQHVRLSKFASQNPDCSSAPSILHRSVGALSVTILDRSLVDQCAFPERHSGTCGGARDHVRRDGGGEHHEGADAERSHHD